MSPEAHRHEVGEETSRCRTCQLEEESRKLSPFEAGCWNWYWSNANRFALAAGSVDRMIARLGLEAGHERLFIRGLNLVGNYDLMIQHEDARN